MEHKNLLYYGDNLNILRDYIKSESIDLIYLDPPFNSNRNYNVLFKDESGHASDAQITAFEDTWHWNQTTEHVYQELVTGANPQVASMISALRQFIGTNQMMAYLVMMAVRLVELHRVLKPTGSLYLHCDPTASHYLKIVLDTIFGAENYRNEITWKRKTGRGETNIKSMRFGVCTDILLFFTKSEDNYFETQYNYDAPGYQEYVDKFFKYIDENGRYYRIADLSSPSPRPNLTYQYKGYLPPKNGWAISREKMEAWDKEGRLYFPKDPNGRIQRKRYLDELKGKPVQNLWDDIEMISSQSAERLGYPTQKPIALLERIIKTSSPINGVVLDPFCGCGTTIAAAQKLNRQWIGIDITHLSIALQKFRLKDSFGLVEKKDYEVIGEPVDLEAARQLSHDDKYQFQWWALSLVKARPLGGEPDSKKGKKGSDRGIDGIIHIIDNVDGKANKILIQVKGGHVKSGDVRDLRGVIDREGAVIGVFITLEKATKEMMTEAATAGFYHSPGWGKEYPRLQILTIAELLDGAEIKMPPASITFKKAEKVKPEGKTSQPELI